MLITKKTSKRPEKPQTTKISLHSDLLGSFSFVLLPRILWCWMSFARAFLLGRLILRTNTDQEGQRIKVYGSWSDPGICLLSDSHPHPPSARRRKFRSRRREARSEKREAAYPAAALPADGDRDSRPRQRRSRSPPPTSY